MSNEVKRYFVDCNCLATVSQPRDELDVHVVLVSDYDALRAENERLTNELEALKAQQAEQKPVAWVDEQEGEKFVEWAVHPCNPLDDLGVGTKLYTSPDTGALVEDAERWRFFSKWAADNQALPQAWGKMTSEKMNFMCDEAMAAHKPEVPDDGQ